MISAIQKNNVSFSAKHRFDNAQVVRDLLSKGINVSPPVSLGNPAPKYIVSEARRGMKIGTESIDMCNAGLICGGATENNLVFHLEPLKFFKDLKQNLAELAETFKETAALLREEGKKPCGLIYGGDIRFLDSKELMVVLDGSMKKEGITPTIMWGTGKREFSDHSKSFFYDGTINTCTLNVHNSYDDDFTSHDKVMETFNCFRLNVDDSIKFPGFSWQKGGKDWNKGKMGLSYKSVLKKYGVTI